MIRMTPKVLRAWAAAGLLTALLHGCLLPPAAAADAADSTQALAPTKAGLPQSEAATNGGDSGLVQTAAAPTDDDAAAADLSGSDAAEGAAGRAANQELANSEAELFRSTVTCVDWGVAVASAAGHRWRSSWRPTLKQAQGASETFDFFKRDEGPKPEWCSELTGSATSSGAEGRFVRRADGAIVWAVYLWHVKGRPYAAKADVSAELGAAARECTVDGGVNPGNLHKLVPCVRDRERGAGGAAASAAIIGYGTGPAASLALSLPDGMPVTRQTLSLQSKARAADVTFLVLP